MDRNRLELKIVPVLDEDEFITCRYCGDELATGRYGIVVVVGGRNFLLLDEVPHRCQGREGTESFPVLFQTAGNAMRRAAQLKTELNAASALGKDPIVGLPLSCDGFSPREVN